VHGQEDVPGGADAGHAAAHWRQLCAANIRGIDAHESGCQPNVEVRETQWHAQRVQQGTRPEDDPKKQDVFIVKWTRYGDIGKKAVKYVIILSCKANGWWASFTEDPSITKLLWPAHFKLGTWRPTEVPEKWQPWPAMKWIIPRDFWVAEVKNAQELKRKAASATLPSSSAARTDPRPPPATQRMKRNRRKLASNTALLRVWTKTLARNQIDFPHSICFCITLLSFPPSPCYLSHVACIICCASQGRCSSKRVSLPPS